MRASSERKFYGAVTVSERGQIAIPAEARRDFKIDVGDKMLVFGDLKRGIGLVKASVLTEMMTRMMGMFHGGTETDGDEEE